MTLKHFTTLSEAMANYTPQQNPDQDGTRIVKHLEKKFPTAKFAVLFLCGDLASSNFGKWTVVAVGPDQTYQTLEQVEKGWLNDLPSQRQYPVAYTELNKEEITK